MLKFKFRRGAVAIAAALLLAPVLPQPAGQSGGTETVHAAIGDKGVDWSKYQGNQGRFVKGSDKFAIAQVGGYYDGYFVDQPTYATQVQYAIAQGKRAHSYVYVQASTVAQVDQALNHYLPQVQTPKGSIVALDVESGNPTTAAIRHGLERVKAAGWTPVLYGYKAFLTAHLDLASLSKDFTLWLGEYPDYQVRTEPNYSYFPSWDNIGIFQFTSMGDASGLDYNIDLTGITDNGYTKSNKPVTTTPAIAAGKEANATPKKEITSGFRVKVNFGAKYYATGETIPSWVKGQNYPVIQTSGNRVLLGGIMSWISRSNVEILSTTSAAVTSASNSYVVRYGDTLGGIAAANGLTTASLASRNGISNWNYIYVGQHLTIGAGSATRSYTVKYGDNLSMIAANLGTTISSLAGRNGIVNTNLIYPGQMLSY